MVELNPVPQADITTPGIASAFDGSKTALLQTRADARALPRYGDIMIPSSPFSPSELPVSPSIETSVFDRRQEAIDQDRVDRAIVLEEMIGFISTGIQDYTFGGMTGVKDVVGSHVYDATIQGDDVFVSVKQWHRGYDSRYGVFHRGDTGTETLAMMEVRVQKEEDPLEGDEYWALRFDFLKGKALQLALNHYDNLYKKEPKTEQQRADREYQRKSSTMALNEIHEEVRLILHPDQQPERPDASN